MRKEIIVLIIAMVVVIAFPALAAAEGPRGQRGERTTVGPRSAPSPNGWLPCPRCQNNADRAAEWEEYEVEGHDFDPQDLNGVWGFDGVNAGRFPNAPPMTEYGQQWLEAREAAGYPQLQPESRNTPGLRRCDPMGYPRFFGYNYGFEFLILPDRVLQFFEWDHTWRTIWTDGREIPEDPPMQRFLGWNVGHWEGDIFVIESAGFDERAWISDEMRIEERYQRVDYGTLAVELTINDPKAYTEPFTISSTIPLVPGAEIWESFCVPSDELEFDELIHIPVSSEAQE